MKRHSITEVLDILSMLYKDYPLTELQYKTPFQLLVAVMLSAQTTDKQVNIVTASLFSAVQSPADVVAMTPLDVATAVKGVNYAATKARNLYALSQLLVQKSSVVNQKKTIQRTCGDIRTQKKQFSSADDVFQSYGYMIPDTLDELTTLPGVGIKTARVVLNVLYGQKRIAVDTHVHRVVNRLGIVDTTTPEQTTKQLETIIPNSYKDVAHRVLIYFGRYHCTARKPKCETCPFQQRCPRFNKNGKFRDL